MNSRWLHRLKPLRERYPYHFEVPDEHYVGLALYSRLPLENARVLQLPGEPSTPAIAATLKAPGGDVEIVLVHPMSPINADLIRRRNEQIRALAEYVRAAGRPLVIAGDFNLTMWNAGYRPLTDVAELHNARKGHGVGPTWPSIWRLGVPIDHILGTQACSSGISGSSALSAPTTSRSSRNSVVRRRRREEPGHSLTISWTPTGLLITFPYNDE